MDCDVSGSKAVAGEVPATAHYLGIEPARSGAGTAVAPRQRRRRDQEARGLLGYGRPREVRGRVGVVVARADQLGGHHDRRGHQGRDLVRQLSPGGRLDRPPRVLARNLRHRILLRRVDSSRRSNDGSSWQVTHVIEVSENSDSRPSVELRSGVAGPLDLVEPRSTGDEQGAVPEPAGGLAFGRRGDDRAEEGDQVAVRPGYVDDRRTDVQADRRHALVVALAQRLVVLGGLGRGGEFGGQAGVGERRLEQGLPPGLLPDVDAGAERRVQRPEYVVAVLLLGGDGDPDRTPVLLEPFPVLLRQVVATLVEDRQAHHVEADVNRPYLLDLEQPAGGQPGPRARRVEPHVGGDAIGHDRLL